MTHIRKSNYLQLTAGTGGVLDLGDYRTRCFRRDEVDCYAQLMCDEGTRGAWVVPKDPMVYAGECVGFPMESVAAVEESATCAVVGVVFAAGSPFGEETDLSVFLAPEHQGRGLGRHLLAVLVAAALDYESAPTVCTKSWDARACELARSSGFREAGPVPDKLDELRWRYSAPGHEKPATLPALRPR